MSTATKERVKKKMIRFRLQEILDKRGQTLIWLAEETGIRYATLLTFKNNTNERINLHHLYTIMNALNIDDMNDIMRKVDA